MISLTTNPTDPDKLILTATVSLYLDRVLVQTLNDEIASQITAQARKDLRKNPAVQKIIAEAATKKLLMLLHVEPAAAPETEKQ